MQKVGIFAHPNKPAFREAFPNIIRFLRKLGLEVLISAEVAEALSQPAPEAILLPEKELPGKCEMILSFGGDGTILRTIQLVGARQTPVLGINVGGLGFLTEIPLDQFEETFQIIHSGKYSLEERLLLQVTFPNGAPPMLALNEVTIEKGRSTRVIEVSVQIDGKFFNDIVADGLIISTPTGSTGYSLSSGGPIVVPTSQCMILNPICPHSLTNRPVIIPSASRLDVTVYTEYPEVIISADNQDVREFPSRSQMQISAAPFTARLVKHPQSDYFSLLRSKLNWGEDFRNKLRWSYKR
ncbi:MAG: NAD(+)/NADH kinase [Calditrichia bacterium]